MNTASGEFSRGRDIGPELAAAEAADASTGADGPTFAAMLRCRPTSDIEASLEQARQELAQLGDLWQFRPRETAIHDSAVNRIQSLEKDLVLARRRDALRANRPDGCDCLGSGIGKRATELRLTGVTIYREHCSCPEGQARRVADEAAKRAESDSKRRDAEDLFRESLPAHFANSSLDTFPRTTSAQGKVIAAIELWLNDDSFDYMRWLFMHGPYGTGKTGAGIAAAAAAIRSGLVDSAEFIVAPDLLDSIRHSFDRASSREARESDVMERYRDAELLVLDDLGAERATDFATERLFVLLNYRHDHEKPTIITSNLGPVALGEHIGERTMHRIAELSQVIAMTDCPDIRAAARKPRLVQNQGAA